MLKLLLFIFISYIYTQNNPACGITSSTSGFMFVDSGSKRTIYANQCPGYNWTGQTTGNTASQSCYSFTVSQSPLISLTPTFYVGIYLNKNQTGNVTIVSKGRIGVAISTFFLNNRWCTFLWKC